MSHYIFTQIIPVFAQNTKAVESTISIIVQVGAVAFALISFIISMIGRRKQVDDKAQAEELKRYTDTAVNTIVPIVSRLDQADKFRENSITDFKRVTEEALKQLNDAVRTMSQQCTRHQTAAQADTVAEIKKELQRFSNRLTRIDENMREYQDTASEKYVPATIYNRDLKNWSDTFQEVRTSLRDLSAILVRMLEAREGKN